MKKWIFPILGILLGIGFLYLSVKEINFDQIGSALSNTKFYVLPILVLFTIMGYFARGIRLKILFLPVKKIKLFSAYINIQIANFYNHILPSRAGEIFRLHHFYKSGISRGSSLGIIAVEKSLDVFALFILFIINLFVFNEGLKISFFKTFLVFTAFLSFCIFLILIYFKTEKISRLIKKLVFFLNEKQKQKLEDMINSFASGLHVINKPFLLFSSIMVSLFILVLFSIPVYLSCYSSGISLSYGQSYFLLMYLFFSVLLPSSPGYVGTIQYFYTLALTNLGIFAQAQGLAGSIIFHISQFIAAVGIGLILIPIGYFKKANQEKKIC